MSKSASQREADEVQALENIGADHNEAVAAAKADVAGGTDIDTCAEQGDPDAQELLDEAGIG